ncbi:hypothetical protein M0I87_006330, partial [Pseudomonas aeruginosa]|nr:glycosyltransferase [Pseudomonas aeruginosa]EKX5092379.1 glycosyltransferase [Pseudomonas aeruginosa]
MIEEATSSKHSDTTDAPLVSVVAPCFNAEKYLEEALRSIYEQDYLRIPRHSDTQPTL